MWMGCHWSILKVYMYCEVYMKCIYGGRIYFFKLMDDSG